MEAMQLNVTVTVIIDILLQILRLCEIAETMSQKAKAPPAVEVMVSIKLLLCRTINRFASH